jgi:hypothetical protein
MGSAPLERTAMKFTICDLRVTISKTLRVSAARFQRRHKRRSHLPLAVQLIFLAFVLARPLPTALASSPPSPTAPTVILVVGAAGDSEFGTNFLNQAELWQKACSRAAARTIIIGLDVSLATAADDHDQIRDVLDQEPKESLAQLWLVLIGHGTFDGKQARFNLRGPDVSAEEMADWLHGFSRPLAVIDTSASSAPFLTRLSATNRVVISATRSGSEQNYTRFGQYFAAALGDPQADIDHDGETSLLEAFLVASRQATEFYKQKGRLVTEHALIDDNGDARGTPADWFKGLRAAKQASDGAALDGNFAQQFRLSTGSPDQALTPEQLAQRDALERAVLLHREKKASMPEEEYYAELEKLLLQLATIYASASATNSEPAQ